MTYTCSRCGVNVGDLNADGRPVNGDHICADRRDPGYRDEAYGIVNGNFANDTTAYAGMRWDEFDSLMRSSSARR